MGKSRIEGASSNTFYSPEIEGKGYLNDKRVEKSQKCKKIFVALVIIGCIGALGGFKLVLLGSLGLGCYYGIIPNLMHATFSGSIACLVVGGPTLVLGVSAAALAILLLKVNNGQKSIEGGKNAKIDYNSHLEMMIGTQVEIQKIQEDTVNWSKDKLHKFIEDQIVQIEENKEKIQSIEVREKIRQILIGNIRNYIHLNVNSLKILTANDVNSVLDEYRATYTEDEWAFLSDLKIK